MVLEGAGGRVGEAAFHTRQPSGRGDGGAADEGGEFRSFRLGVSGGRCHFPRA
jgi:hypothetical protein